CLLQCHFVVPPDHKHHERNAFDQLQDGQRPEEGQLDSVLPAAAPGSQFRREYLETGIAREAGGEDPWMKMKDGDHGLSGMFMKDVAEEAGGPRQPRADRCPPPPRSLPPGACQAARCQADSECPRHRRCCYNGCAYACLEAVPPPPVLDWLVQPKPRWLGGNGWLLDGPEEALQAEACSTTEDGAEPLLCPSGYECHILSPGDLAEGIPNSGQCVKQRRPAEFVLSENP
ncbi:hypothetical protein EI555_002152, partial [Monodon monoceros]